MDDKIKIGDLAKDICGDIGEVIDIEYNDNGRLWRYILAEYNERRKHNWTSHPDYTIKLG